MSSNVAHSIFYSFIHHVKAFPWYALWALGGTFNLGGSFCADEFEWIICGSSHRLIKYLCITPDLGAQVRTLSRCSDTKKNKGFTSTPKSVVDEWQLTATEFLREKINRGITEI